MAQTTSPVSIFTWPTPICPSLARKKQRPANIRRQASPVVNISKSSSPPSQYHWRFSAASVQISTESLCSSEYSGKFAVERNISRWKWLCSGDLGTDGVPDRWQKKWLGMEKDTSREDPPFLLQQWLEEISFDPNRNAEFTKQYITRVGDLVASMLKFEPSAKAQAKEVLAGSWFRH
ncbi:hypothetical protein J7T55_014734 [Diaporthe amygdali]|uniref:uncharacterized protein n=1 Tax=Phomopsis amygdali TaxID=1214568 RepID=UPI0022FE69DA|nr:uncharacterized protein J7T55_014734 [Diaporthe amygdali]KAJ0109932.1 hypothetical protein J7T55_014734 [Diaporthe amygdali]